MAKRRRPPSPPNTPVRRRPRTMGEAFPEVAAQIRAANSLATAVRRPTPANVIKAAVKVGTQAYRAYTQMKSTQTSSNTRTMSGQNSVSGGKFSNKRKKNAFAAYTRKGIVSTYQTGAVVSGVVPSLPVYVGHASHGNTYLIHRCFWRAAVRDIFKLHGVNIADIETDSPGPYSVVAEYTTNLQNADLTSVVDTTGKSYQQIASEFVTNFNTITNSFAGQSFLMINEVRLLDGTKIVAKRDYRDATINVLVKSDLKIQNRTLATGVDEDANSTENVANQPLYGKSYTGRGNGLICKVDSPAALAGKTLTAGEQSGVVTLSLATQSTAFWLNEPPLPTLFTPRPKYARASIEPGTVRTSSLIKSVRMRQSDFWQMLNWVPTANELRGRTIQSRYGLYRIFAFEKMITASAADTPPVIGIECNQRCGLFFSFKRNNDSAEVIENATFLS